MYRYSGLGMRGRRRHNRSGIQDLRQRQQKLWQLHNVVDLERQLRSDSDFKVVLSHSSARSAERDGKGAEMGDP